MISEKARSILFLIVITMWAVVSAVRSYGRETLAYTIENFMSIFIMGVIVAMLLAIWGKIKQNLIAKEKYKLSNIKSFDIVLVLVLIAISGFFYGRFLYSYNGAPVSASTYWLIAIPAIVIVSIAFFIYYKKKEA